MRPRPDPTLPRYHRWTDVPLGLRSKTQWWLDGRTIKDDAKPAALICSAHFSSMQGGCDLYREEDTTLRTTKQRKRPSPMARQHRIPPATLPQKQETTVSIGHMTFPDLPGFGFEVVTLGTQRIFLACTIQDGMIVRPFSTRVFQSQQEAEAFKEQVKRDAQRPHLIIPGSQEWNALSVPVQEQRKRP